MSTAAKPFQRSNLEQVLTKKFFYIPSFEIYGGIAGLYDYGPPGCSLQTNILTLWRQHFVLEEDMLELECTNLTPEQVFKTSGHVERFADFMVTDSKTGDIYRADHLVKAVLKLRLEDDENLSKKVPVAKRPATAVPAAKLDAETRAKYEEVLETLDNYQGEELGKLIKDLKIVAPGLAQINVLESGNEVTDPVQFNLMFDTQIGPTGQFKGYLRPETAQGHFINFKRLLEYNNEQMPFASATIGKSFRNEISPRQGLLRVREFTMCEIEHYVHPDRKDHPRFAEVSHMSLPLYSKEAQLSLQGPSLVNIGEAVSKKLVDNQTLGYFLTRIYTFLIKIGIDPKRIRFRQHMENEMAHYASDCWDAEIESSYGWIECVGCADRSAYDLTCHMAKTGVKLIARDIIPEKIVDVVQVVINKSKFGPKFGKMGKTVASHLEAIEEERLVDLQKELSEKGSFKVTIDEKEYEIQKEMVEIKKIQKKINVLEYTPNVIEPSFGVGRILYSLLEHCYYVRGDDEQKAVFKFPPSVAPTKALVVPLSKNAEFDPFIKSIVQKLRKAGISNRVDNSSGSIGKRYARNDELGTPFGITIDFDTVKNGSVTLRERDSTKQIRASQDEIVKAVEDLVDERVKWDDLVAKYGEFTSNA